MIFLKILKHSSGCMPTTQQWCLILINSNVSSLNTLYVCRGGVLGLGCICFLMFLSLVSNTEQICVALNVMDCGSLPIWRYMIVGIKYFTHLGRILLRNLQRTLYLLYSLVDFKFTVHQSLGDLVRTDV